MPSDEELRKVAEDIRTLARSLARDVREAAQSARRAEGQTSDVLREGLRDALRGAQREFHRGMRQHWYGWTPPPSGRGWRPDGPPVPGQPPADRPGAGSGRRPCGPGPAGAGGWNGPPPWGPWGYGPSRRSHRSRGPMPPVRKKWDVSMLAALLAVVFGAAWLISGLGLVHLSTEAVLAAGLMLLGAALIVTARTDWSLSRHYWPVWLGVVLVVGLFATSSTFGVTGALSHLSVGKQTLTAKGSGTFFGGIGQFTVDATSAPPGAVIHVQSVVGETLVKVPAGDALTVQAKVLAGQVCINGRSYASGIGASPGTIQVQGTGQPVTIDARQTAGVIEIGQAGCGGHR